MRIKVIAGVVGLLATLLVFSLAGANWPEQSCGQGSSDIWVMNLDETEDANVVAAYIDQNGDAETTVGGAIDPLGNTSFPASSSGLGDGWLGSMVLYSDQELASAVDLFWQSVPRGDGWSGGLYSGCSEGSNEIFFPVVSRTYYHRSLLTIQCVDTVDCPVWLTYRGEDGSDVAGNPFYEVIEADSQETHDVWDPTLNPNVPTGVTVPWYGSLHVTSTQEIAGVSVTHWWLGYAASYNALVPGTDTELHFTSVNRRNWASWHGQSDWSQITIQNLNPFTITIYQTYYDRDGGPSVLQIEDDIPAYSSHLYNTRYGDAVDPSVFEALGDTFLGSVLVTSTHPIAGTGRVIRYPSYGLAGAYQGVPSSASSNTLRYPVAYRVINGNAWVGYSSLFVQNLDTDDAITVHIQYLNSDGSVGVEFDDEIPANSTHPYNTRYGGETPAGPATFEPLGNSWRGPIIVTTTSPEGILGMVNNHTLGSGYIYLGLDNIH